MLQERIPGFKVKLGFGLHLGWAIEGMIGSNFKADASYLSPQVNLSARLESETKQYGVLVLISEEVQSILSPEFKELTRIVDKAVLKGFEHPINMYTVDIDLDNSLQS